MPSGGTPQSKIDMGASMETEAGLAIIEALNEVSDVLAMAGPQVTFVGERVASLGPLGRLQRVDVYACPRGWFVLCREPSGPHWSVAGTDLAAALVGIDDHALREGLRQQLRQQGIRPAP